MPALFVTPEARPHILVPGRQEIISHTVLVRATELVPAAITAVAVQLVKDGVAFSTPISATLSGTAYVATVPSALLSGEEPSDKWAVIWTFTIGGVDYSFRRLMRIVRVEITPTVTSSELIKAYPDLQSSLRASTATLIEDLAEAWEHLDRDLFDHGIDIHKVFDPRHLARLHKHRAALARYAKAAGSTQDARITDRADELERQYKAMLQAPALYDRDSDGVADGAVRFTAPDSWDYVQRRRS